MNLLKTHRTCHARLYDGEKFDEGKGLRKVIVILRFYLQEITVSMDERKEFSDFLNIFFFFFIINYQIKNYSV